MKKFLFAVLALAFAAAPLQALAYPSAVNTQVELDSSANSGPHTQIGTQLIYGNQKTLKCIYDFAVLGGGATGTKLLLRDPTGELCKIPAGAVITSGLIDVKKSLAASVYTSSTVALSSGQGASDLKAGQVFTTYDATGVVGSSTALLIPQGTTATMVKIQGTADVNPYLAVNGILTAGKINVWINFLLSN